MRHSSRYGPATPLKVNEADEASLDSSAMPLRSHVVFETDRKHRRFFGPVYLFIRFLD
jgi:hypothetical protein